MEYGFRLVSFQMPTGTGNFDITVPSGFGSDLTPKLVVIFVQRATAVDTITASELLSVGVVDGTAKMAGAMMSENGQLSASNDSGVRTSGVNAIEITGTGAQGLEAEATFVSFAAGKVTLNFAVSGPSAAYRAFALFGFGAGLSAAVQSLTGNPIDGDPAYVTGLPFDADGCIVFSWNRALSNPAGGQDHGMLSIGFAGRLPSTSQASMVVCREDRAASPSPGCLSRGDRVAMVLTSTVGVVAQGAALEVTDWPTGEIEFTTRDASSSLLALVVAFSVGGRRVFCDLVLADTNATGSKSFTDPGFPPCALIFAATPTGADGTIVDTGGGLSIGAATKVSPSFDQALISGNFQNGGTNGAAQSLFSSSLVVDLISNSTTHDWKAAFTSFDSLGWTYEVTDASSTDELLAFMAIEEPPRDHAYLHVRRRWPRQLGRM